MTEEIQAVLTERQTLDPDAYVFGDDDGKRVRKFHGSWRKLYRAAGLPDALVWHDIRHEFVSDLIDRGANISEAAKPLVTEASPRQPDI